MAFPHGEERRERIKCGITLSVPKCSRLLKNWPTEKKHAWNSKNDYEIIVRSAGYIHTGDFRLLDAKIPSISLFCGNFEFKFSCMWRTVVDFCVMQPEISRCLWALTKPKWLRVWCLKVNALVGYLMTTVNPKRVGVKTKIKTGNQADNALHIALEFWHVAAVVDSINMQRKKIQNGWDGRITGDWVSNGATNIKQEVQTCLEGLRDDPNLEWAMSGLMDIIKTAMVW